MADLHPWDLDREQAVALQRKLAGQVRLVDAWPADWKLVGGVDVSHSRFSDVLWAAVVVLETEGWTVVERRHVRRTAGMPYLTGLLSFREAPAILEAFDLLESRPDGVMVDGAGVAHPRRLGIATHLGLWLDLPTVGCAKTRLIGDAGDVGPEKGSTAVLTHRGEPVGHLVRTRDRVKPLYISAGHLISQDRAVREVLDAARGYRLPEPTRQAHAYGNEVRTAAKEAEGR